MKRYSCRTNKEARKGMSQKSPGELTINQPNNLIIILFGCRTLLNHEQ